MSRSASLALILAAWPAVAQEKLPMLSEVMADVLDTEVYIVGSVTEKGPGVMLVRLPDGTEIPAAEFEVGSGVAEMVADGDCMNGMYCAVTGYGVLGWSGPRLGLLIYSIETLGPPATPN